MSVPQMNLLSMLGQSGNFNNVRYSDNLQVPPSLAQHGDMLVSELHGKRYHKGSRGNLFWGTSGTAGASLLAPGGTTAGFVLFNPPTSGKLIEVEKFRISGASVETDVISGIVLEGGVQTPSGTLTGASISAMPLGGGALGVAGNVKAGNQGQVYKAATITAATFLGGLGLTIQATTSPVPVGEVDFDGTLILSPGMMINFCSSITQGANLLVTDVFWSEFLP